MVSILLLVLIVTMMATTLFSLNRQTLLYIGHHRDRVRALQMARGGLNHVLHTLTYYPGHGSSSPYPADVRVGDDNWNYAVTFDPTRADRSVNNLEGSVASPNLNFQGEVVNAGVADVVVVGTSGWVRVRVHALVQRGLLLNRSVAAGGRIALAQDCLIDGIKSVIDPVATGGGLLSRHVTTGPNDYAVAFTEGSGTFQLANQSKIEAPPSADSRYHPVSDWLRQNFPDRVSETSPGGQTPEYDVTALVKGKDNSPPPARIQGSGGNFHLTSTALTDERYVNGNVVINGDLDLSQGSLYVKGNLTVNGSVRGRGSLYVDGNVTVQGGSAVVQTDQATGTTLLASGDVTLKGLDAAGYLDALATAYPSTVGRSYANLKQKLVAMQASAEGNDLPALWWQANELHRGADTSDYVVNPVAAPNGNYSDGTPDSLAPRLILDVKASLGASYATDPVAQKVVRAVNEIWYQFHHNLDTVPAGAVIDDNFRIAGMSAAQFWTYRVNGWDDGGADPSRWSVDRLWSATGYSSDLTLENAKRAGTNVQSFFKKNPTDFSFLGNSWFQGVVYAGGSLTASNRFSIVGAVVTKGDATFNNGCSLIFDEEYMKTANAYGPVRTVMYEEL